MAETRELRRWVDAALASLPGEWRRVLLLGYVEGRTNAEVAKAIRRPASGVKRVLEYTRQYLRQRLVESGCRFKEDDSEIAPEAR